MAARPTRSMDLTAASPSRIILDSSSPPSRKRKRASDSGPSSANPSQAAAGVSNSDHTPVVIEDIEEGDVLDNALQKQREDQVASQKNAEGGPTNPMHANCTICLDDFTDLVAAKCGEHRNNHQVEVSWSTNSAAGHVFCHECLELSLRASERRQGDGRKAQCPSCRKPIIRKKPKEVIHIKFMSKAKYDDQQKKAKRKMKGILGEDTEA